MGIPSRRNNLTLCHPDGTRGGRSNELPDSLQTITLIKRFRIPMKRFREQFVRLRGKHDEEVVVTAWRSDTRARSAGNFSEPSEREPALVGGQSCNCEA